MKIFFLAVGLALSAMAAGQQQTVCSMADIPKGWVAVSTGPVCAGNASPLSFNIQRIDTLPSGTVVQACGAGRLPQGWVTLSWGGECASYNGFALYSRSIQNLNGMPQGTVMTMCACSPVPEGWILVSEGGTSCGKVMQETFHSRAVRKL